MARLTRAQASTLMGLWNELDVELHAWTGERGEDAWASFDCGAVFIDDQGYWWPA